MDTFRVQKKTLREVFDPFQVNEFEFQAFSLNEWGVNVLKNIRTMLPSSWNEDILIRKYSLE